MSKRSYISYFLFSYAKAYSDWVITEFRATENLQNTTNRYSAYSLVNSWQAIKFPLLTLQYLFDLSSFKIDFNAIRNS